MADHFNKLTPAEAERLAILAEEAGEVVQAVGKILRHGYDSYNPDAHRSVGDNRRQLAREVGDMLAIIADMQKHGDIRANVVEAQRDDKLLRLEAGALYLHHQ